MKPKTKKIIIIAVVLLAAAFVLWLLFRKKSTKSLLEKLGLSDDLRAKMESKAAEIEAYAAATPTGEAGWSRESIQAKATSKGVTYSQMVLIEAAYALFSTGEITWSEYSAIENRIKTL